MSLAVLKRKSRHFKAHVSGQGMNGFSINGGRRNQGWVGQDTLGRHLGRTPFRGVVPVGHGGNGGEYKISIVKGGPCSANDPDVIKRSTMNTAGHIDTTVNNPTGVFNTTCTNKRCAKKWVKDFNAFKKTQGQHIKRVQDSVINCERTEIDEDGNCRKTFDKIEKIYTCKKKCYFFGNKRFYIAINQRRYNKFGKGAETSGDYTEAGILSKMNLPTPPNKAHFPMALNHLGNCDINYMTPEDAIEAGDLPADWMEGIV